MSRGEGALPSDGDCAGRWSGHAVPAGHQDGAEGIASGGRHPGIELVAAEAADAGAERLVIVTSQGKDSVVAHFVEDLVLEARSKSVARKRCWPRSGVRRLSSRSNR